MSSGARGERTMADLSKRYKHDGTSFLAFTPGLSMAVLRPFFGVAARW